MVEYAHPTDQIASTIQNEVALDVLACAECSLHH